jgi:hypothetical protein
METYVTNLYNITSKEEFKDLIDQNDSIIRESL